MDTFWWQFHGFIMLRDLVARFRYYVHCKRAKSAHVRRIEAHTGEARRMSVSSCAPQIVKVSAELNVLMDTV